MYCTFLNCTEIHRIWPHCPKHWPFNVILAELSVNSVPTAKYNKPNCAIASLKLTQFCTLYQTASLQIAVCSAMQISQGNKTVKVTFNTKFYEKPKFPSFWRWPVDDKSEKKEHLFRWIYFSGNDQDQRIWTKLFSL